MDKVIHWELNKKSKFDLTKKWCMQNPESIVENETHKLLWDFEIQTNHLISAKRIDLLIINKTEKTYRIVDFAVPVDRRVNLKESEKNDKYQDFAKELKKIVEHESDGYTNCNWCSWYSHERIGFRTGGLGNKRRDGVHPNYSIIEIGQNTEKSPGDLKRFTIIQTPVRNNRSTLLRKVVIIMIIITLGNCQRTKKTLNMKVTVILIVISALGTIPKDWKGGCDIWKFEGETRPTGLQHCWDRPDYWD